MKGISIAIAMDYGVVGSNNTIDCQKGGWYYGGRVLRDAGHSYGRIPVWKVVQKSSNIGTDDL